MSFINDALKDAGQSRSKDDAPSARPQLMPADCPDTPGRSTLPLTVLTMLVMLISGFLMLDWFHTSSGELKARARTYDSAINPVSGPPPETHAAPVLAPVVAASVETNPVATDSANAVGEQKPATTEETTKVTPVAVELPKPAPITYKLQGIIFQPGRCSAVINGKTVVTGDRVAEARVKSIDKDSVVIVTAAGQTILLELP
jgi:hypothetical protein